MISAKEAHRLTDLAQQDAQEREAYFVQKDALWEKLEGKIRDSANEGWYGVILPKRDFAIHKFRNHEPIADTFVYEFAMVHFADELDANGFDYHFTSDEENLVVGW